AERLLPRLAGHFDIHLYGQTTPPSSAAIRERFPWFPRREYELQRRRTPYDLNVYQIGNNPIHQFIYPVMARYPGAVVLHDANVHHARAYSHLGHRNLNDYLDELTWCHGEDGTRIGPAMAHGFHNPILYDRFPMLDLACRQARSVLVHNAFARDRVSTRLSADRIFTIPLPWFEEPLPERVAARQALGIESSRFVIGLFGFMTPGKGIESLVRAFRLFRREYPDSLCALVGTCLDEAFEHQLEAMIAGDPGIHSTGYVDDDVFRQWLAAIDAGVCLRYPSQGESSDALLRMMGARKPVIVPDYRQFREIPSDACVPVPVYPNESYAVLTALRFLAGQPDRADSIASRAQDLIRRIHHSDVWETRFVTALHQTIAMPVPQPLARCCPLRHVRVPPVVESVALAIHQWGDAAKHNGVTTPLAQAMTELGLNHETTD
ncbi:glycosyltransferase, partial [bacterium]|nr:glycosyltransferase [candidate division CSSED10-310 bacterium]